MNSQLGDISLLVDEYSTLVSDCSLNGSENEVDFDLLKKQLIATAEWTPASADALVSLVQEYGAFVLRNALALAIALSVEDGNRGI